MTRANKKESEAFEVERMLKLLGERDAVVYPGVDPPDVLVRMGRRSIGIEVTHYNPEPGKHGTPRHSQLAGVELIRRWLSMAQCARPDLDGVHCTLYLNDMPGSNGPRPRLPKKEEYGSFTKQVTDYVSHLADRPSEWELAKDFSEAQYPLLRCYLVKLELRKRPCYMSWDVECEATHTMFGPCFEEQALIKVVQDKRAKLALFLEDPNKAWLVHEVWLVVVSGDQFAPTFPVSPRELNDFSHLNDLLIALPDCWTKLVLYNYYLSGVQEWDRGKGWTETVPDTMFRGRYPR